jgi:hypothetical protein
LSYAPDNSLTGAHLLTLTTLALNNQPFPKHIFGSKNEAETETRGATAEPSSMGSQSFHRMDDRSSDQSPSTGKEIEDFRSESEDSSEMDESSSEEDGYPSEAIEYYSSQKEGYVREVDDTSSEEEEEEGHPIEGQN